MFTQANARIQNQEVDQFKPSGRRIGDSVKGTILDNLTDEDDSSVHERVVSTMACHDSHFLSPPYPEDVSEGYSSLNALTSNSLILEPSFKISHSDISPLPGSDKSGVIQIVPFREDGLEMQIASTS